MAQSDFAFSTAYLGTESYGSAVAHSLLANPLTSSLGENCRYWADDGSGGRTDAPKGVFARCIAPGAVGVSSDYAISLRAWFRMPASAAPHTALGLRVKGSLGTQASGYNFFIYQNKLYSEMLPGGGSLLTIDGDLEVAAASDAWHRLRIDVIPIKTTSVLMDRVRLFTWDEAQSAWMLRAERYYEATDTDFVPWENSQYNGVFMINTASSGAASTAAGYVDDFRMRTELTATAAKGPPGIISPVAPPTDPLVIVEEAGNLFGRSTGEFGNLSAFAALKDDGSVVTWGDAANGGDSSAVAAQLSSGVKQVYSTQTAFAALKQDGTVVAWGDQFNGGAVGGATLSNVSEIFSTSGAFAALKTDGSVTTWGNSARGGDSSAVAARLASGVSEIFSSYNAFVALKDDGSVVSWGSSSGGGDAPVGLTSVSTIRSTDFAFAALKDDGTVSAWGGSSYGGANVPTLSNIAALYATGSAFAAVDNNGAVYTWGNASYGGDASDPAVAPRLTSGVTEVFATLRAFAALKNDGTVVTWGDSLYGADSSGVASDLTAVSDIFVADRAFAALKTGGSVVTWGASADGGDSSTVSADLSSGVTVVVPSQRAFAAVKDDGSVVAWGNSLYGGDASSVSGSLSSGVSRVFSIQDTFAALKEDGSVVVWGARENLTASQQAALGTGVVYLATPKTDDQYSG